MPVLRPNADPTTHDIIFTRALQDLLAHMGRNPPRHANGVYDLRTQRAIRAFQQQHGLLANGDVNTETWQLLRRIGCKRYTS
jgi:peptidoglycan hydrolase-like protein with peptidoglycan-binding domain